MLALKLFGTKIVLYYLKQVKHYTVRNPQCRREQLKEVEEI